LHEKILIVEDETLVAKDLAFMLDELGYEVTGTLAYAEKAVEEAENDAPDLVLMDIRLKGKMDGITAADIINTRYNIPVIFLTAYPDSSTIKKAKVTAPFGYIIKPVDVSKLEANIEIALYKHTIEQKIRDQRNFLQDILENSPDPTVLKDPQDRYIYGNRAFLEFTASSADTIIGKRDSDFFPAGETQSLNRFLHASQKTEKDRYKDFVLTGHRGPHDFSVGRTLLKNSKGEHSGMLVVFRDISALKTTETKLREKQSQLEEAQHIARIGALEEDIDAGSIHWSETLFTIFQRRPGAGPLSISTIIESYVEKPYRQKLRSNYANIKKAGIAFSIEIKITTELKRNRTVWLEARIAGRTEKRRKALFLFQDISRIKQLEDAGRQLFMYQSAVISNTQQGFILLDRGHRLQYANAAAQQTPLLPDGLEPGKTDILGSFPPPLKEKLMPAVKNAFRGISGEDEICMQQDGHSRWFSVTVYPASGKSETVHYVCLSIVETTEKKMALKETQEKEKQLVHADRLASLGTLTAGVGHEINNPNQSIKLSISVLKRIAGELLPLISEIPDIDNRLSAQKQEILAQRFSQYIDAVESSSDRIDTIVKELKYFAKADTKPAEWVDLNTVIQSAVTLSQNLIKKSTERFKTELSSRIPHILGNYQRLEQVLINLIQNSCQALTDKSRGIFISSMISEDGTGMSVLVEDEGKGINDAHKAKITDPFFTTNRDNGGLGLGLSISSTIVAAHGGTLTFQDRNGGGTRARIFFPTVPEKDNYAKQQHSIN
jgi:PAS domain S-box-containing protein